MYHIALADDDNDLLNVFEDYCSSQPDLECVFTVNSVEGLIPLYKQVNKLDYLFLDLDFDNSTSISSIGKLKKIRPHTDIVAYTMYDDDEHLFQALSAGANGYLLKNVPLNKIKSYIEISSKGGAMLSPFIARKIIQYFNPASFEKRSSSREELSPVDKQVLKLLADGKSYKMIGRHLGISVDSVRYHIKKVYKYLHVNSKAEAIKKYNEGNF